jgi:hypothetical protein
VGTYIIRGFILTAKFAKITKSRDTLHYRVIVLVIGKNRVVLLLFRFFATSRFINRGVGGGVRDAVIPIVP